MGPMIRSCIAGVMFLSTRDTGICERWTTRVPNTAPNPFHVLTPVGDYREIESTRVLDGRTQCQWIVATSNPYLSDTAFAIDPGAAVARLQAAVFTPFTEIDIYDPVLNGCDADIDGSVNVNDFILFLNCPYDWNQDGSLNVLDYIDFLNRCR